jgi:transposase
MHLAAFRGFLHADGYVGFGELYAVAGVGPPSVVEVGCWAHARRKFFECMLRLAPRLPGKRSSGSARCSISNAASPGSRRSGGWPWARPKQSRCWTVWPSGLMNSCSAFPARASSQKLSAIPAHAGGHSPAIAMILSGDLEPCGRKVIRPIALGRNNWLFAGSDAGGERAAIFLHHHPYRQAQRPRARGLSARSPHQDGRASNQSARRMLPWKSPDP